MISFINVFLKYTKEYFALSNVSFDIKEDEVVAFVGQKDSGKTCIMRILAGLEKIDKGEVYVNNIPVEKLDYKTDVSMGYIPHRASFFNKKTVYENLKYVLDIRNIPAVEEKINQALATFKLERFANEKIYKLSLFQRYLVSIARLSLRDINILLVDNIFDDLPEDEGKELVKLIKKHFVKPGSIVLVSTTNQEIANLIATRTIKLKYGAVEEQN